MVLSESDIKRFWSKVIKSDGCWSWTGAPDKNGYGVFRVRKKLFKAHRVSFFLEHGVLNPELEVCHHCDNPPCTNPEDLYQGTHHQNMLDLNERYGNPMSKLSLLDKEQIVELREDGHTLMQIAEVMNVSYQHVSKVLQNMNVERFGNG